MYEKSGICFDHLLVQSSPHYSIHFPSFRLYCTARWRRSSQQAIERFSFNTSSRPAKMKCEVILPVIVPRTHTDTDTSRNLAFPKHASVWLRFVALQHRALVYVGTRVNSIVIPFLLVSVDRFGWHEGAAGCRARAHWHGERLHNGGGDGVRGLQDRRQRDCMPRMCSHLRLLRLLVFSLSFWNCTALRALLLWIYSLLESTNRRDVITWSKTVTSSSSNSIRLNKRKRSETSTIVSFYSLAQMCNFSRSHYSHPMNYRYTCFLCCVITG